MNDNALLAWVTHIYEPALEHVQEENKWTKVSQDIAANNGHTYRVTAWVKKGSDFPVSVW